MASCYTEPPATSSWIQGESDEEKEQKSPQGSSNDESEESEPEPSLVSVVKRKVSFADAFGLDLVSVKEFDNKAESAEGREAEEYHMLHLFNLPASDEELELRLRQNKLELERIELVPGSATIRGIVRVLNLSYHKVVYVRVTMDGWQSHFDQVADYVPGSSDGDTDCFSFHLSVMPPFAPDSVRVEFCLCYESSSGIFWANNGGMNYVLFCQKRGGRALIDEETGNKMEENDQRGKRSCLKPIKKGSCAWLMSTDLTTEHSEQASPRSVANRKENTLPKTEGQSRNTLEESNKTLAEGKTRRRAAHLAYLQEPFSHRVKDVELGQTLHREKPCKTVNAVLPLPQLSVPVKTDTSDIFQACSRKKQHGNTSSDPSDHKICLLALTSLPMTDDLEKEQTENVSTDFINYAWKEFLNGPDSTDNQNKSLDQKCLFCIAGSNASQPSNVSNINNEILSIWNTQEYAVASKDGSHQSTIESIKPEPDKLSATPNSGHINEMSRYKYPEKAHVSYEPHTVQASELVWAQGKSGINEAQIDRHIHSDMTFTLDEPMLYTNPGQSSNAMDDIRPHTSNPEERDLLGVRPRSTESLETEMKVKGHTSTEDTLAFTNNKPCTNSTESSQIEHINERELKKKNQNITEENMNTLYRRFQDDEEYPSYTKYEEDTYRISSKTSVVCDKGEPYRQTECLHMVTEEAVCYELVKTRYPHSSDCEGDKIMGENDLIFNDEGDNYKVESFHKTCPHIYNLCRARHGNNPSGHFTFESEVRYREPQDLQDPGMVTEIPKELSKTSSSSVGTMFSWLFVCWARTSTMHYITVALVCAILCVIFVTAYLHNLPVCLAIYMLSACWWCRKGMKKHVTTAESVD